MLNTVIGYWPVVGLYLVYENVTVKLNCVTLGFRCEVQKTALFWDITQRVVVISYRLFGTTSPSSFQGSRVFCLEDGADLLSQFYLKTSVTPKNAQLYILYIISIT